MIRTRPQPRPYRRSGDGSTIGCLGVIVIVVAIIAINVAAFLTVTEHTACIVHGKDRTASQTEAGASDARVYTSCGTFKVADDRLRGRFDSADDYGAITVGQTYDLTAAGWRIPFLSWFPNILDARPVPQP